MKDKLQNLLNSNDPNKIYEFALKNKVTEKEMDLLVEAICSFNQAIYIFLFALNIPNLNIQNINKLTSAICKTKRAYYIYYFGLYIYGANIDRLALAICKADSPIYKYLFRKNIPNLSKRSKLFLKRNILNSNDKQAIALYLVNVDHKAITEVFHSVDEFILYVKDSFYEDAANELIDQLTSNDNTDSIRPKK